MPTYLSGITSLAIASNWAAIVAFDRVLRLETPRLGPWLDNSGLTVSETVARIQGYLTRTPGDSAAEHFAGA